MGDGALKAEVSLLNALPPPQPTERPISSLCMQREQLAYADSKNSDDILYQIDDIMLVI
jgi:hypothetical protein